MVRSSCWMGSARVDRVDTSHFAWYRSGQLGLRQIKWILLADHAELSTALN